VAERVMVSVAPDECVVSTTCLAIAPDVFELAADADATTVKLAVLDDQALVELAREAEQSCPSEAIRVEPAPG
jgi:ferredoxin